MKRTIHLSVILVLALIVFQTLQAHSAGLNAGDQMTGTCSNPASAFYITRDAISFQTNEYANPAVAFLVGQDTLPFETGKFRSLDDKAADCPEGYQCTTFEVVCTGSDPARGVIAYGAHTGDVAKGLIMLFKGGEGKAYWTRPPVAYQMAEAFRRNGYDIVQVRWIDSWLLSSPGKDAGIARLAARPATVIKEVYARWYVPLERNAPDGIEPGFCLTGNSGGASQISYALSHYGLDTILDVVVPTGGPPHAALAKSMLQRPGEEDYWYNEKRRAFIDKGFGFFDGNGPGMNHDAAFTERWNLESVATGGNDYYHPNTRLHFIIGGDDRGMYHVSKDYIYRLFEAGNPDITLQIVPGTPHNIMRTEAGRTALKNAVLGCLDSYAPEGRDPEGRVPEDRNQEGRNQEGRNQEGRNQEGRNQEGRDRESRDQGVRNQEGRNQEGRDPESRDPGGRDPGVRNQESRDQGEQGHEGQGYEGQGHEGRNTGERTAEQMGSGNLPGSQGQSHRDSLVPAYADVSYGRHERNVFDFWKAEADSPTPLVVFIHGGGFRNGDKSGALNPENSEYLKKCLANGVSFASINYPYNSTTRLDSIMLHAARAIQFFRNKSGRLHIDKDKIAAYGGSAGGGISLWLAVHDDLADPGSKDPVLRESSRLTVAGHVRSQATYDFRRWSEFLDLPAHWNTGTDSDLKLYRIPDESWYDSTEIVSLRKELDMIGMIDPSDPPVYFRNYREGSMARQGEIVHHPAHAIHLSRIFDQKGIDNALMINDTPEEERMNMMDFFFNYLLADPVQDPAN